MGHEPQLPAGVRELHEAAQARESEAQPAAHLHDDGGVSRAEVVELLARMGRDGIITFVGTERVPMLRSYGRTLLALLPAIDDYAANRVPDAHAASVTHHRGAGNE